MLYQTSKLLYGFYTPLHLAAYNGRLEVVRYLTNFVRNVDIKTDYYWNYVTPVQLASQEGHTDVVNFLIRKGARRPARTRNG